MISSSDRKQAVELIQEANRNGARLTYACNELNISVRTYERWTREGTIAHDQRPLAKRPVPKNKLTDQEREKIIETVSKKEFMNLPPSQIVPKLADCILHQSLASIVYCEKKICNITVAEVKFHKNAYRQVTLRRSQMKFGLGILLG
ncbi:helix-turn-helix domain-containing protein [Enterococcus faecium]|uniref:helix-turn-helix domain-containing protein n=1 Tax=Enterococcus faecium TaxID=1352 RepID=UPI0002829C27|nr:helix-turn-helix domain-containing protein [Enterococcus faecium]EJX92225.1 hypothetical protein HMPREF1365_02469 [Enterococcus faecium ERV168]